MMRGALLAVLLGATPGCRESLIVLDVDAELAIPSQADSLQVVTLDAKDLERILADVDLPLSPGQRFPVEVLLDPSADTPPLLRERVTARLAGTAVARNEVEHKWEDGRVSRAKFSLLPVN